MPCARRSRRGSAETTPAPRLRVRIQSPSSHSSSTRIPALEDPRPDESIDEAEEADAGILERPVRGPQGSRRRCDNFPHSLEEGPKRSPDSGFAPRFFEHNSQLDSTHHRRAVAADIGPSDIFNTAVMAGDDYLGIRIHDPVWTGTLVGAGTILYDASRLTVIPEPGTASLLGVALLGLAGVKRGRAQSRDRLTS